ncbi:DMT family transporter [Tychonema sp. LEGE 07199]|uniref:DMT family transporter n=1 Tax=unclassified Tychonema TaxID=2642144 RepID=UPI001882F876|nr:MULTISPECIES: DMT family transporter [unclassified Tychonema]MBE9120314.1 DMT family transporter [Tychonema sp. LEGE 07199]MBE9131088.1 DMT family transporter [Tychonema sp. LEGE 07196]
MGEIAALGAAFVWALSSTIWQRVGQQIPAVVLNFLKGAIALFMLLVTVLILGKSFPAVNSNILAMLLISGALGIGLGDTAWFVVLKYLGARRALLLETLSPPLTALLGFLFLQEKLSPIACTGILLTICGVAWVISERTAETTLPSKHLWLGLGISLLGQTAHAAGAVLSRAAFNQIDIDPLWTVALRLSGGIAVMLCFLNPKNLGTCKQLKAPKILGAIILAAFLGTYLGIFLQQTSLKYAPAAIAQTLSSASPLFVLPLAVVAGEKVSFRAVLGVVGAIAGIALLLSLK